MIFSPLEFMGIGVKWVVMVERLNNTFHKPYMTFGLSENISLPSEEFVGVVADDPSQKIQLKGFHGAIANDHTSIKKEEAAYADLPPIRAMTPDTVEKNYLAIKRQVTEVITLQLDEMRKTPELAKLIISKKEGQMRYNQSPNKE